MRVDKRRFFLSGKVVNWIPSTFQIVDKWYSRIWLGMSCRCVIRFRNFYFEIRVEKRRFFSESCNLSFMYISRNSKQIICQNVIGQALQMPNKIQEVTFCPLRYKRNFKKLHFYFFANVFSLCGYYLPLEKCMTLLDWTKYLYPRILSVISGWNWPSGSGEDFQKLSKYFQFVAIISHYKKDKVLYFKET